MPKRKRKIKKTVSKRFMAMSKLIGFIIMLISLAIIIFSMIEMHITGNLDSLPTLIGGIFGLLAAYVGFYINMAKAEHIEDKKNQIKKELELIRRDGIAPEERSRELELENELQILDLDLDNLKSKEINCQ